MKFEPKPNHYYRRMFEAGHFSQDIILISPNCKTFEILWGLDFSNKWLPISFPSFFLGFVAIPDEFIEYNSLEDLMADMFVELM